MITECVKYWTLTLTIFFLGKNVSSALKDVSLKVPAAVEKGQIAVLHCSYDLEGDQLYAVKWYKGEREFFRYAPKERPAKKQFKLPRLKVSEEISNETHLVLEDASLENSGSYSCEVSADEPSFITGMQTKRLQVVEVPKSDPTITGLKRRYREGDTLRAECTSSESRPAANLTWLVNGLPVDSVRVRTHKSQGGGGGGLLNAHSGLRLQIKKDLFVKGKLKIRCISSMSNVYYRSSEKSVELEKEKLRVTTLRPPGVTFQETFRTTLHFSESRSAPLLGGSKSLFIMISLRLFRR